MPSRWTTFRDSFPSGWPLADGFLAIGVLALLLTGCGSPIELPAAAPPAPDPPPLPPPPAPVTTVAPPVLVGVPSNVNLGAGDGAVALTWNLVNGAQFYRVEWQADPLPLPGFDAQTAEAGSYEHASLLVDRRYRYAVTAGGQSTSVSAVPSEVTTETEVTTDEDTGNATETGAPASVGVAPSLRQNTISWEAVSSATAYRIYWAYAPNVTRLTGTRIDVDATLTSYAHAQLEPGAHYYYIVTAFNPITGESGASTEVGATPGQPAGVTLTAREGAVTLSWPSDPAASISVAPSRVIDVSPIPSFPVGLAGLENNRRHAFSIRPVFSGGLGPSSSTVYAVPKAATDGVPKRVTIQSDRDVNTLSWEAVTGAAAYDVIWDARDLQGNALGATVTVTDAQFRHTDLVLCTNPADECPIYRYRVRVSQTTGIAPEVSARAVDLRSVPPLITNTDYVVATGIKPAGSRVLINGMVTVPFDTETGWTATLPLDGVTDREFTFRLVAVNTDGVTSTETTYRVTRDTESPLPLMTVTVTACDAESASPRRITLAGAKEAGVSVYREMDPAVSADVQIVGATDQTAWSGVIDLDDQPTAINLIAKDAAGNQSSPALSVPLSSCP
ncbi:MAG: hypothetical protein ACOYXU_13320 [Nitrospirota bacterium]